MGQLGNLDFGVITVILLLFVGIPLFQKVSKGNIFKVNAKIPWGLGAASLLIIYWNPTLDMVNTRLVVEKGYSGLWFLKDVLITVGIAPVLFVPLWARLNIVSDNELLTLRFSGKSAVFLKKFRAVYVGVLVASLLCSFYTLGIYKIVRAYYPLEQASFFIFFGLFSIVLVFKNTLLSKMKTDLFVSVLYIITIISGLYFLIDSLGGWVEMREQLLIKHYDKIQLIPEDGKVGETIPNIIAFMFIQWWSARILDHSSINSQRYFAIGDAWRSFKAIFLPIIVISITFALSSFIWDAALLKGQSLENAETSYVSLLSQSLPSGLRGALAVTFILGFVTTFEAIMSWGAAMISVEFENKRFLGKELSSEKVGYFFMFLISFLSLTLAMLSDEIYFLIKFLFSISIGVGPVIILRWFWWRINAWSQLSAMLASGLFAIGFDLIYQIYQPEIVLEWLNTYQISWYVFKLYTITPLVTICWLLVTFLTKPDDISHLKAFVEKSGTGGVWPFSIASFQWRKKLLAIICLGFAGILPLWIIWLFKFGSADLAFVLTVAWLLNLVFAFRIMKSVLFTS